MDRGLDAAGASEGRKRRTRSARNRRPSRHLKVVAALAQGRRRSAAARTQDRRRALGPSLSSGRVRKAPTTRLSPRCYLFLAPLYSIYKSPSLYIFLLMAAL
jgi:hypothetical protein